MSVVHHLLHRNSQMQHPGLAKSSILGRSSLLATVVLATTVAFLSQGPAEAQTGNGDPDEGAAVFAASCASCHQAGGVGVVGTFPPLLANQNAADPEYVADVITNGLSGPIEVDGVFYDAAMPAAPGITGADLDNVVAYVVSLAGAEVTEVIEEPAAPIVGSVDRGHDLFEGSDRFERGGAACAACHTAGDISNLGGWSLGPDLTNTLDTLGGEVGFSGWMANPPAPTMAPVFADKPLTEQELADLAAFLDDAPTQDRASGPDRMLLVALGGLAVLIGGMAFVWRGMRQTYVELLRSKQ